MGCPICTEYPEDKSWHRPEALGRDAGGHHPDCPLYTQPALTNPVGRREGGEG